MVLKLLGNLGVNLQAAGPAAVMITWAMCVTSLGLFGAGPLAKSALGVLSVFGGVLVAAFAMQANR